MTYYEQLTFTGKGDVEEAEETAIYRGGNSTRYICGRNVRILF